MYPFYTNFVAIIICFNYNYTQLNNFNYILFSLTHITTETCPHKRQSTVSLKRLLKKNKEEGKESPQNKNLEKQLQEEVLENHLIVQIYKDPVVKQ